MTDNGLFNNDWMDLQRRYWEGWTDLSRKAMGAEQPKTNPWEAAMDHWWQAFKPAAPDPSRAFMERMMDQGKVFFDLVEQMTRGLGAAGPGADPKAGWDLLNKTLAGMQDAFAGALGQGKGQSDAEAGMQRMLGFWELPLDNWQRMMSTLAPTPGDWLRNMPHGHVPDSLHRVLSAPGLGYTREEQGQYQELVRCGLDYQRALTEYAGFFSQLGVKSVQRMRELLTERGDAEEPIDSARALYDAWVGCCEAVYAEEVSTREYASIHGRLVNADMALKKRLSVLVDENLGAWNMPTRSELRTLQDRLQETRRENKRLRHDLEALKRRVADLAASPEPAAAKPPAARKKTVARKKTAAKPDTP
jgi:class III poly(R)-hydroxyalkanoic acid synthase PhaE subunit